MSYSLPVPDQQHTRAGNHPMRWSSWAQNPAGGDATTIAFWRKPLTPSEDRWRCGTCRPRNVSAKAKDMARGARGLGCHRILDAMWHRAGLRPSVIGVFAHLMRRCASATWRWNQRKIYAIHCWHACRNTSHSIRYSAKKADGFGCK